ncbi:MAG: glycosyltransferase family 1 protein [Pseudomonadota bacterium]
MNDMSGKIAPQSASASPNNDSKCDGPLRIAIFSGNYNYVVDGPVRALNTLVAHLEHRGHDVLVFAPTVKNPPVAHNGELIAIPSVPFPGSRSEYRIGLGLFGAAKKRLDAFAPDVIHIAAPDLTGLQALKYAEEHALTPVASFHTRFDTYLRYYGLKRLEKYVTNYMRRFYSRCQHVYAPSPSMRDELAADRIGQDVRIWARGVDSALFSPEKRDLAWRRANGISDDSVVVLFVGRVVLEKGIDVFAEALTQAAQSNNENGHKTVIGLIVGEGPERERFQQKLPDAVFTGFQEGQNLARAYASADVFFNPSVTETFGNVTLEAMASGLPTVAVAAAGSRSLVEDGKTGLLAPLETDKGARAMAYAQKLRALADQPDLRATMAKNARQKALEFNWEAVLDGLIANYHSAMADRNEKLQCDKKL